VASKAIKPAFKEALFNVDFETAAAVAASEAAAFEEAAAAAEAADLLAESPLVAEGSFRWKKVTLRGRFCSCSWSTTMESKR